MERIGVDLGGTKTEAALVADSGEIVRRIRRPTPAKDYEGIVQTICDLVEELGAEGPVGVCTPGALNSQGRIKNSNTTVLIGRPLKEDLEQALGRRAKLFNDANCFALSESVADGAAAKYKTVFGVILGTGVGGGLVVDGVPLEGATGIAGEWGHNPLPWMKPEEFPGRECYCGMRGCVETFLSGPGWAAWEGVESSHDIQSEEALARYEHRLARALAHVINVFDPEAIVLGGGLSKIERLYKNVPRLWEEFIFSDEYRTRLLPNRHGDSSGVRGAAWLWR